MVPIFQISPKSPISLSAHRWHSTHIKRLNQKMFPPWSKAGTLLLVYIQPYTKDTLDSVSMYCGRCEKVWYITMECLWNVTTFQTYTLSVSLSKPFTRKWPFFCINAAPGPEQGLRANWGFRIYDSEYMSNYSNKLRESDGNKTGFLMVFCGPTVHIVKKRDQEDSLFIWGTLDLNSQHG